MNIEWTPFSIEKMLAMDVTPERLAYTFDPTVAFCKDQAHLDEIFHQYATCVLVDGEPVAAFGLFPHQPKACDVWCLFGKWVEAHPRMGARWAKRMMGDERLKGFDRVQAIVDADWKEALAFAFFLGFDLDTPKPLEKWCNGRDAVIFSRLN